jgi:hypothetical protein
MPKPSDIRCSFCGRSHTEGGSVAEFPDRLIRNRRIWICRECATMAVEMIDGETHRGNDDQPDAD